MQGVRESAPGRGTVTPFRRGVCAVARLAVARGVFLAARLALAGTITFSHAAPAETPPEVLARRLATRIAIQVDPPALAKMTAAITSGDFVEAAKIATQTPGYGDVFLFSLLAPMCTLTQNPNVSQSPCSATLQYIVWKGLPFTQALTSNYQAYFTSSLITKPVINPSTGITDQAHYDQATALFNQGRLSYVDSMTTMSVTSIPDNMGVVTLDSAAPSGGYRGTNRRFIQLLFRCFLGIELEDIRDALFGTTSALNQVRRDVFHGAPDPRTLIERCATCHGGLDPMAAAFNKLDYPDTTPDFSVSHLIQVPNQESHNGNVIAQKILDRENMFADQPGFVDSANSPAVNTWRINYTKSPYGTFNWGATTGNGVNSLGIAVAATLEFRINVVRRIWKLTCGQEPATSDIPQVIELAKYMQTTAQDRVTPMVWAVATLDKCLGR